MARLAGDFEHEAAEELASLRRAEEAIAPAAAPSAGQGAGRSAGEVTWVNHGNKHVPQRGMSWRDIVKSTEGRDAIARYHPNVKDGMGIEALEREAWETGTPVIADSRNATKIWKVKKFNFTCGACCGEETPYVRIEYSSGFIHGHPITETYYNQLLKRK